MGDRFRHFAAKRSWRGGACLDACASPCADTCDTGWDYGCNPGCADGQAGCSGAASSEYSVAPADQGQPAVVEGEPQPAQEGVTVESPDWNSMNGSSGYSIEEAPTRANGNTPFYETPQPLVPKNGGTTNNGENSNSAPTEALPSATEDVSFEDA
jgi:hypothetical protein